MTVCIFKKKGINPSETRMRGRVWLRVNFLPCSGDVEEIGVKKNKQNNETIYG